jgi:hypothetical protein
MHDSSFHTLEFYICDFSKGSQICPGAPSFESFARADFVGVILRGAVLQAERRISPLNASWGRSFSPLEKARGFGMTPVFIHGCVNDYAHVEFCVELIIPGGPCRLC